MSDRDYLLNNLGWLKLFGKFYCVMFFICMFVYSYIGCFLLTKLTPTGTYLFFMLLGRAYSRGGLSPGGLIK